MKFLKFQLFLFLLLSSSPLVHTQDVPKWKLDIDEPIEFYEFINNGKYLFITSGENVWTYNSESGTEVWSMEVDGFEKEGISRLIGELYLTNSNNKLQAYDALTGKLLWENEYSGISQSDFDDLFFIMNNAMFDYDDYKVGIDLNTGKELYRTEFTFWSKLVELGTYNYNVIDKQKKLLVLEDSEIAALYDITTGAKLYEGEDYNINEDLIKNKYSWSFSDPEETGYLFVLNDEVVLLDLVNNKEAVRKELDIDGDKNVILPTTAGAAVMGEDKMIHINFKNHNVTEISFPFDDVRTLSAANAGGKNILILGLGDQMAALDLVEGKLLWQTAEDDPQFEGYAHRYIEMDGDNLLFTYNRPRLVSEDYGTYIYLMSINVLTGKLNYKTPVLLSKTAMSDFTRGLTKAITGAFGAVMSAGMNTGAALQAYEQVNEMMGYNNIGFNYNYFDYKGDIVFESRAKETMWNPATREEPGEGFVRVNKKSGEIVYASYFALCDGLQSIDKLAPAARYDNLVFTTGDEKLVGFNLDDGKVMWTLGGEAGFVTDIKLIDGVLHTKFGKQDYDVFLKEDDVEVKELFSEDPFGFMAVDASSGKILWKLDMEADPALYTPQFSIDNYYDEKSNRLYYSDDQNVYALKLGRAGGNYDWKYNFSSNSLGEMEYEESFAVQEKWIGSVPRSYSSTSYIGSGWSLTTTTTTGGYDEEAAAGFLEEAEQSDLMTTYTSWGNIYGVSAKKCLKVMYGNDQLLVIAPEGFALLNAADGSEVWKSEWSYDSGEVSYIPKVYKNSIVYCLDENLIALNLLNGSKKWTSEESETAKYFTSPNQKFIYSINDETIRAYPVE